MKIKAMKKPVVIEAVQWTGNNFEEIKEFCGQLELPMENCPYDVAYCKYCSDWVMTSEDVSNCKDKDGIELYIRTLEGDHKARIGDYVIKGVRGEYYPCEKSIFEETYNILECDK